MVDLSVCEKATTTTDCADYIMLLGIPVRPKLRVNRKARAACSEMCGEYLLLKCVNWYDVQNGLSNLFRHDQLRLRVGGCVEICTRLDPFGNMVSAEYDLDHGIRPIRQHEWIKRR